MIACEPQLRDGFRRVVFAKDQPEYLQLPALVEDADRSLGYGTVITAWRPDWRERLRLILGCDLTISMLTFGKPLQPLNVGVEKRASVPAAKENKKVGE